MSSLSAARFSPVIRGRRLLAVLVGAACFGLLMAAIKGQGADARDAFGNLSAPWLLLSFLAGSCAPRIRVAALVGLAAALTALAAFYIGESLILDLGGTRGSQI